MSIEIVRADLTDPQHGQTIVELLDVLACSPDDGGKPLSDIVKETVVSRMQSVSGTYVFLAYELDRPVGLAVCFQGFSTFNARPLLNIHDLVVHPDARQRGVARKLLDSIEQQARDLGCCRLTLEVRADNHIARRMYVNYGFDAGHEGTSANSYFAKSL